MRITLDLRKTVEQNAGFYFDRAKKFKAKAKGARAAVEKFKAQLSVAEEKKSAEPKKPELKEQTAKHWYEKFRWFLSSEGYLCVGGRDAGTNELLVKKHVEPHDLICHTESPGSPFFIIKTEGTKPKPLTVDEALQATASYSRGWKLGVAAMEAYCVTPEQVSKEAQSGEFMSKGAFMIRGKRETKSVPLKLAIGLLPDGRIMAGPETAIKRHCPKHMLLTQGTDRPSDAAKKIQKYLQGGDLDAIIRALPAGELKVAGAQAL
ncbi:MAG TPA: NFACT RNA binding domain-containing protein [Candidatus Binatia bacterium]|nr:NFACT RNA binding domain-containing protein [Candidatus Binatia bacterium]